MTWSCEPLLDATRALDVRKAEVSNYYFLQCMTACLYYILRAYTQHLSSAWKRCNPEFTSKEQKQGSSFICPGNQ